MSPLSPIAPGATASLSTGPGAALPVSAPAPIDPALEPESVRNGDRAAKSAYQTGLAFEQILVNELAQAMTATVPGLDGSPDGSSSSADPSDASGAGAPSGGIGAYATLLPQALSTQIMAGGGTGVAMEIAGAIDPALDGPPVHAGAHGSQTVTR